MIFLKNIACYAGAVLSVLIIAFAFLSFYQKSPGAELIRSFGWEINTTPIESASLVIPEIFDEIYEDYNLLQTEAGLDLEQYKGRPAVRYTYEVLNYPDNEANVRANVIVVDGKGVAGDICTVEIGGFMHALSHHPL